MATPIRLAPLAPHANRIRGMAGPSNKPIAEAFDTIQGLLQRLAEAINAVPASSGGTVINNGAVNLYEDVLLVSATLTTITGPAVIDAASLDVFVKQPASGSAGTIAWGSNFMTTPTGLAQTLGTWSVFNFIGKSDGKWWLRGNYRTGVVY